MNDSPALSVRYTPGAAVAASGQGYRLSVPAGKGGTYRLAQCDDYSRRSRNRFPHYPPFSFSLRARVSAENLPGTWGFGLWNDPFGLSLGFGGTPFRLPALPNAVWFFYASTENYLTLTEKVFLPGEGTRPVPANGFFAGTFCSPRWPAWLLAPALVGVPLLCIRPLARLARRLAARPMRQDGAAITVPVTEWHTYTLHWSAHMCEFRIDERLLFRTALSPAPPLGLVIWIDNQYAAFTPQGRWAYGTLTNPAMWLDIENLSLRHD